MVHNKRIRQYLRRLLSLEDTPERIAKAFALGVFITFSPLVGLHTLLALAIAFLFGLNRVAVLLGLFINNPWTLVPFYTASTYVGGAIIGFPGMEAMPQFGWNQFFSHSFWLQLFHQWPILMPMALGSTIISVMLAFLSYAIALRLIKRGKAYIPA